MSLSVIPLTILGQITGVSGSGGTVLYQVSFKSIDGTPLYGVAAVWTDEQAEIEALAAEKPYGVWINPINGTFTVKFAGYTYTGSADLTDDDVLAGVTPIQFTSAEVSDRLLPEVAAEDNGKMLQVDDGEWKIKQYPYNANYLFNNNVMSSDESASPPIINEIDLPEDADLTNMSTWEVYINGESLPWNAGEEDFLATDRESYYRVLYVGMDPEDPTTYKKAILEVSNIVGGEGVPIVGTFHLIIKLSDTLDENFKDAVEEIVGDRLLPEVTDADNGKVLAVVNGAWDKAEAGGGQSGGKSGIRVSLHVTDGTIESVYIGDEEATLGDLFDYGWENVSQISISEDSNVSSGAFLLQNIQNFPSGARVTFGTLSLPGAISSTAGNGYINYITINSDGSYTKAYSGTISITAH